MVAGTAADTCIQPPSTLHRSTRMHHLTHTVRRISRRMPSRHTATRLASASALAAAAAVMVVDITEAMAVTTVAIAETIMAAIMVVVTTAAVTTAAVTTAADTTAADTTVAAIITVITKIWPSGIQPGSFLRPGFFIC